MPVIIFTTVFAIVIALYAYLNVRIRQEGQLNSQIRDYVMCVEAGDTDCITAEDLKESSYYIKHQPIRDYSGHIINDPNTIRIKTKGDCMVPIGINNGDELLVHLIDRDKPLAKQIEHGDVLLIHIQDNGINKIRIFDTYDDKGNLLTYRYKDNVRKNSSRPHSVDSVVGVVRYQLS